MLVKGDFISKLVIKSEASNSKTSLGNEIYAFVNDQAISIPFSLQKCLSKLEIL